jgi:hypothetical protein
VVIGRELIVTNHHVVEGGLAIQVRQGKHSWPAKLEAFDPKHDLALLRVAGLDLPRVSLRASAHVAVGERVFVLGAPRGLELTLSDGLVSALRREKDNGPARIQTTAPVSPGSSGGGLFDNHGQLIGIITFSAEGQNLNFAHPTEWIEELTGQRGTKALAERPHKYNVSIRPERLRCALDTEATWALFSGGAEIVESRSVTAGWDFYRLDSQTPQSVPQWGGGFPTEELVLHDLNRAAEFVSFVPANEPKPDRIVYFTVDDEDRFRVTILAPFDFHGQLRVRAESGPCKTPQMSPQISVMLAPPKGATPEQRCNTGEVGSCVTLANLAEPHDRVSALKWLMKGCEGATQKEGVPVCERAAKLCDGLGFSNRAAELRTRGKDLAEAK